ncbi:MAG: glycosyltransferase [Chloroflexi bacterium]|nr:glycosyltransferase [Chloroflexota bacterium]
MGARVTVIVPVKDDDRLAACVASLLACRDEVGALQVLVVDNGSAPAFRAQLAALPEGVTVLEEARPGAYAARNRGLEAATGGVVFFTDADCVVHRGWFAAALDQVADGADLVQGWSGSLGRSRIDRLLQRRYEAHLRRLRTGDATECDTRNLAVRRAVFDNLRFNDRYRRVGDTEFGLLAEVLGYRVAYCPAMRVEHAHERDLPLFLAKQVCHGWGAQRLMRAHPEISWHGGHLKLVAKVSAHPRRLPGRRALGSAGVRVALASGAALQRHATRLPPVAAAAALGLLDKLAALSGHLLFEAGAEEPSPSGLLGRRHPRD